MTFRVNKYEVCQRQCLYISHVQDWPLPKRHCRFEYAFEDDDVAVSLEALRAMEKRKDIDSLYLDYRYLFNEEIQQQLEKLFQLNDRAWVVDLEIQFPLPVQVVDESRLRTALSKLASVERLTISSPSRVIFDHEQYFVLDNLPKFPDSVCLNLRDWVVDQHDIEDILNQTLVPPCTTFCIVPMAPFSDPVIPKGVASNIHSLYMYLYSNISPQAAMAWAQAAKNLPCLEELKVVLPASHRPDLMQAVQALFSWLKSPQCPVLNLVVKPGYEDQIPLVLATIPEIPLLKSIGLNPDLVDFQLEPFLRAIAASPSINYIWFDSWVFDKNLAKRLVEFQLIERPRWLTIALKNCTIPDHAIRDQITSTSLVHHALKNFHQFSKKNSLPISVWPIVLETLGESIHDLSVCQSYAVAGVGAMFDMLKMFLPSFVASLPSTASVIE